MSTSSIPFQLGASSSIDHMWTHDVFLSFRGEDVRQGFISHLYRDLHDQRGINAFIDNNLERGEEISHELSKAIEGSKISIIVLSKNYSESKWCLDELLKILDCKETVKQIVLPLFYYVDPSEVRHQKGNFGQAFAKLKNNFKDEVRFTKWEAALEKVANLSGLELGNSNEAEFIQTIGKWVDSIIKPTVNYVIKHPVGIEARVRDIYQLLNIERNDNICMVGIFGPGGIGKTTISKEIYNKISYQFEGRCFLQNIRETSKAGLIRLQKELLRKMLGISLKCHDTDEGINVIRHRLPSKRVLLILDDVDDLVQIETLAGARDWFGLGSRIIITTRDQHILDNLEVDSKYEVKILNHNEALELFSLHAFKKEVPLEDYMDLSQHVINYAQGLPLALTVLGSDLYGLNIDQWKSVLDKYRKILNQKIQSVLQISYDSLEVSEKEMFLDIAFFFKGEPLAKIMDIFHSCNFFPVHGIQRLMDKCLISVEGSYIDHKYHVWMHDLLQDMGKEVVQEKSYIDPNKRSRLWFHEDVRQVLEEDMGPNQIEGIVLDLPEGNDEEIRLHPKAFRHMKRLRVFINRNARFSDGPNYLSNELRVLDWYKYPVKSLPCDFQGKKLIVFNMRDSLVKELGDGFRPKNLTTMTFYDCKFLKKTPDFSSISNLKELTIRYCKRLVEVHDSVGSLKNLSKLDFEGCSKLQILPRSLELRSLCELNLRNCSSLRDFPEIECKMECLWKLILDGTAVVELPLSIRNLVGLEVLSLLCCRNLMHLPIASIPSKHLLSFCMGGHESVDLPNDSTTMEDEISNSSNGSTALQVPNLQISCSHSEPNFFPLYSLFAMFNSSATLDSLFLYKLEIVSLPKSIKESVTLTNLYLCNCRKLEEIPELPPNIRRVDVRGCESLEIFPEVSKILEFNGSYIKSLGGIELSGCYKMHSNIWNDKVQNPFMWKGVYGYDATFFPENQIPATDFHDFLKVKEMVKRPDEEEESAIDIERPQSWKVINGFVSMVFKDVSDGERDIDDATVSEFLKALTDLFGIVKGPDDDVQPRKKEEWVIEIEGPHYLEEISGIVLYVVIFFIKNTSIWDDDRDIVDTKMPTKITSNDSNHVCRIQEEVRLVNSGFGEKENRIGYFIWVGYSNLQSFDHKVLDNLQVEFYPNHRLMVPFYESYRTKVVYKNERRASKKRKIDDADVAKTLDH